MNEGRKEGSKEGRKEGRRERGVKCRVRETDMYRDTETGQNTHP
jgi:hypothetical protein